MPNSGKGMYLYVGVRQLLEDGKQIPISGCKVGYIVWMLIRKFFFLVSVGGIFCIHKFSPLASQPRLAATYMYVLHL